MKRFVLNARALFPAVAVGMLTHGAVAEPSNKWRIEFDEVAQTEGVIVLNVTPAGGTPVRVEAQIPAGTHENQVASLVREALQAKLGAAYSVEVDDGEDVLVKKEDANIANFDMRLVSSSATGLQIELERE